MKNSIRGTVAGLLAAALLSTSAWAVTYQGVDIAHYAYSVDFNTLKSSGHGQFVYIKTSEGVNWRDPKWQQFTVGARTAGIPFGFYHYFHSGTDAYAVSQADVFWNLIKNTGYSIVPAVDVEETDGNDAPIIQSSLRAFINRFYALSGRKPIIYASTAFINKFIGGGFTDCLLWQAHYNAAVPGSVAGWGRSYAVWQYRGSSTGVPGIDNTADLDLAANDSIFLFNVGTADTSTASGDTTVSTSGNSSDYYPVASLPQTANSRAGTDFCIRDHNGNRIGNHQIDAGDPIIILGVDYNRQLAEVLYPNYAAGGWYHGYITNDEAHLHNSSYNAWRNGSTDEPVYNAAGQRIGTIYAGERATILDRGALTKVLYTTNKGTETKSGYVRYAGK